MRDSKSSSPYTPQMCPIIITDPCYYRPSSTIIIPYRLDSTAEVVTPLCAFRCVRDTFCPRYAARYLGCGMAWYSKSINLRLGSFDADDLHMSQLRGVFVRLTGWQVPLRVAVSRHGVFSFKVPFFVHTRPCIRG